MYSKTISISLNAIEKVKQFVKTVSNKKYSAVEVILRAGKYIIDGKSIMGIFSINITQSITCELNATDPKACSELYTELDMQGFII